MAHSTHKIHEILELDAQNIIEIGHQEREIPAGSGLPDGVAVETRQDMKHSISLPHVEMFNGVPRISETSRVSVRSASFGPSALVVAHRSVSTILADATNITDNDMPQTINHMQDLPQVDLRNADDNFQAPSVFLQEATPIAASPSPLLTNYLSKIAGKSQENLISQASGKPDLAIISQSFRKSILIDEPELEMLSSRTNSKSMYGSVNIQKPTSEYLIFTGAVKTPSFCQVAQQPRFWMRIVQLCLSIGAFLTIFTVDSSSKYHPQLNQSSGSDSLIFISTVSSFVAMTHMAVYVFPKSVGVTPHRCNRFSIVEFTIDELVFFGWAICGIKMALFGECIGSITQALAPLCSEWTIGIIVSFAASAAYMITGYMAARNLQQKTSDHSVMFARGAWI